jgi:ribose 5-phosphate isomerase B
MYFISSDHRGFETKNNLIERMRNNGVHLVDLGPFEFIETDDYPLFAFELAEDVAKDLSQNKGILICSSGSGMVIAANKVKKIRAARVINVEEAVLSRQHNDANILVLSSLTLDYDLYVNIILEWLKTPFSNEERHVRRIKEITDYENGNAD